MPEYTLVIEISNAGNRQVRHSINLNSSFVDFPKDYFEKPETRTKLKSDIETQSARQLSEADLDFFIKEWCHDIQQGLKITTLRRDLPPLQSYSTPKTPNRQGGTGTPSGSKSQSSNTVNNQHQSSEQHPNQEPSQTENWSTTNKPSF